MQTSRQAIFICVVVGATDAPLACHTSLRVSFLDVAQCLLLILTALKASKGQTIGTEDGEQPFGKRCHFRKDRGGMPLT